MSESMRDIYRYERAGKAVAADPAVLWRGLGAACAERGTTWEQLTTEWTKLTPDEHDTPDEAAAKSAGWLDFQGTVAAVVRQAFGMAPLDDDGNGSTESEVMAVLSDFVGWREKKGGSTGDSPSSSAPTAGDPPGSSTPSSDPSPTTTSTA